VSYPIASSARVLYLPLGTAALLLAMVSGCARPAGSSYEAQAAKRMHEICIQNPKVCQGGIIAANRVPVFEPWWYFLRIARFHCAVGSTSGGDPAVEVDAYVRNTGPQDLSFPQGGPALNMVATAFTGSAQPLQTVDYETNGFLAPVTFSAPIVNPNYPPWDPQYFTYDDHRISFEIPVSSLHHSVTQIALQFVDQTNPNGTISAPLAGIQLYWPGAYNAAAVSSTPLDVNNPMCTVFAQP